MSKLKPKYIIKYNGEVIFWSDVLEDCNDFIMSHNQNEFFITEEVAKWKIEER